MSPSGIATSATIKALSTFVLTPRSSFSTTATGETSVPVPAGVGSATNGIPMGPAFGQRSPRFPLSSWRVPQAPAEPPACGLGRIEHAAAADSADAVRVRVLIGLGDLGHRAGPRVLVDALVGRGDCDTAGVRLDRPLELGRDARPAQNLVHHEQHPAGAQSLEHSAQPAPAPGSALHCAAHLIAESSVKEVCWYPKGNAP